MTFNQVAIDHAKELDALRAEAIALREQLAAEEAKWKWTFEQRDGTPLTVAELGAMKDRAETAEATVRERDARIAGLELRLGERSGGDIYSSSGTAGGGAAALTQPARGEG